MKKFIGVSVGLLAVAAIAQRDYRIPKALPKDIDFVHFQPASDGGIDMSVSATLQAADGGNLFLGRERTCNSSTLSAAEKACLVTIRTAALACFNSAEGL